MNNNKKKLFLLPLVALAFIPLFAFDFDDDNNVNNNNQGFSDDSSNLFTPLTLDSAGGKGIDKAALRDNVEIIVRDSQGNIKYHDTTHNKVVTLGENCVAKMIFGYSGGDQVGTTVCIGELNNGFNYIALGESSTAVADGDTTLVDVADETGLATPLQATISWTNSTDGSYSTVLLSKQFTNSGSSETIREVGLFNGNNPASDKMYARAVTSDYVIANGDDITVNWSFETGSAAVP